VLVLLLMMVLRRGQGQRLLLILQVGEAEGGQFG
jgi:hypothetical protein